MADPSEFYGFSPQNHQGETPTVTNPKYAVYNYLQGIDPRSPWAQTAADTLNKQFNTQQFKALDQETLGYGDEYVHSGRPGGPGATGSLSNPGTGAGAFTWGSQPAPQAGQADQTGGLGALLQALMGNPNQSNWSNWMGGAQGGVPGMSPLPSGGGGYTPPDPPPYLPGTPPPDVSQPGSNPVSTQPVGPKAGDPSDPNAVAERAMKGVYF